LESGRGIGEPKRHDQELEVAMVGAERRLGDVIGVHPHLVVPGVEVKLGEEPRPVQLIQQFIDHRDRELVFGGLGVESVVVDAETPRLIRLLHQENGCGE
jgi:hypothetical protein